MNSNQAAPPTPSVASHWVGLDIGGANLKAAHTSGWSQSISFPMWQKFRALGGTVAELLHDCPPIHGVALTMTGELADCFATRAQGVAQILEQVTSIVPAAMIKVYGVDGSWKTVSQAARDPWGVAASNWHGLARFAMRFAASSECLLIDVGSTTTDIVPLSQGHVAIEANTDSARMQSGSLVYTGIERSNVVGLVRELQLHGAACPVMNEQFATTRDVYLWLREIPEEPNNCETADNQPATRNASRYRLARLVGEDGSTLADSDIDQIAHEICVAQTELISAAIDRVIRSVHRTKKVARKSSAASKSSRDTLWSFDSVVLSGHGDFLIESALAKRGWDGNRIVLSQALGPELSRCAPAYAIAMLAAEECHA